MRNANITQTLSLNRQKQTNKTMAEQIAENKQNVVFDNFAIHSVLGAQNILSDILKFVSALNK